MRQISRLKRCMHQRINNPGVQIVWFSDRSTRRAGVQRQPDCPHAMQAERRQLGCLTSLLCQKVSERQSDLAIVHSTASKDNVASRSTQPRTTAHFRIMRSNTLSRPPTIIRVSCGQTNDEWSDFDHQLQKGEVERFKEGWKGEVECSGQVGVDLPSFFLATDQA